jgi:hypothetical protein
LQTVELRASDFEITLSQLTLLGMIHSGIPTERRLETGHGKWAQEVVPMLVEK